MNKNKSFTITVPNGFYVGDLCYALSDEVYDKVWGNTYGFEDGAYKDPTTGLEFAMVGTAYGDGYYSGTDGQDYPVDAGIIGVCALELVQKPVKNLGRLVYGYSGRVTLTYKKGSIIVDCGDHNITIETKY